MLTLQRYRHTEIYGLSDTTHMTYTGILAAVSITCCSFISFAQQKPPLPEDYFTTYSFTFLDSVNDLGSKSTALEVERLAESILKVTQRALADYTIADKSDLAFIHGYILAPALLKNDFTLAARSIATYNMISPSPEYLAPFGFFHNAYAKACITQSDDGSEYFKQLFKNVLEDAFHSLHPDFRADIATTSKATYNLSIQSTYEKEINGILKRVMACEKKITFYQATALLDTYFKMKLVSNLGNVVEALLFEISPVKVQEISAKIPMRDGINLSAKVFLDASSSEKVPAIVSLSPYPSGYESVRGNMFASNGYVMIYVNSRGRSTSEGEFVPYENDARDYYDVIDWASKQSWCNGKIATTGGSYLGFVQWQAIKGEYRHPALKAINPMVSVAFGYDFPRRNNIFYSYMLQWASYVSGKESNTALFNDDKFWKSKLYELYKKRIPFSKLDSVAGLSNSHFKKWIAHPDFDNYWKNILPDVHDYENLDIPVLTITGYYDGDQPGSLYYFNNHNRYAGEKEKSKHHLLIGPFDHGSAQWQPRTFQGRRLDSQGLYAHGEMIEKEAQIPIYKYVINWFNWVLKEDAKPEFIKDKINYFVTGTGQWASASSLQDATQDTLQLYLSPKIIRNPRRKTLYSLSPQTSDNKRIKYTHDIAQTLDSAYLYSNDRRGDDSIYMTSPYHLIFESEPLTRDIIITNKIVPHLYLSLNVPDADFNVTIIEVGPDGKSHTLASSNIRARYRNGGDQPELVTPGKIEMYNFDYTFLYVKKLKKGSKVRITFGSINSPWFEKNFGFGGIVSNEQTTKKRIIEATLHTGPKYPSHIEIPFSNIPSKN